MTVETSATPVSSSAVIRREETVTLALADPQTLIEGLRHLQKRIPEFIQLSVPQRRSMSRAANLDPELIETGLQAASAWHHTKNLIRRSADELRQEEEATRLWDEVEREMAVLTQGIASANLKRKNRFGSAILFLYRALGDFIRYEDPEHAYMRPYYDAMRRASLRMRYGKTRKAKKEEPETPEE